MSRGTPVMSAPPQAELFADTVDSPIGPLTVVTDARAVCALEFTDIEERLTAQLARRFGRFALRRRRDPLGVRGKREAYFAGDLRAIEAIAVNPGGTPFQQAVWRALRKIPPGKTSSYGRLAARLGRPAAPRAVGHANALNPVAIVIPCHRLIGSDAGLTGYAGGVERKRWLLRHEGALPR
jgi:methylated-DNA-[protein]-cysteine S-methyltransferase